METDKDLAKAAHRLINEHGTVIGGVLSYLMQSQIEAIMASDPSSTSVREAAYHKIQAIKDVDALLRNLASQHKSGKQE